MANEKVVDLNIYQRLARIRKQVEVIKKEKQGYNYKYVGEEDVLAKVTGLMDRYHLSLIPNINPETFEHEVFDFQKTRFARGSTEPYKESNNEVIVQADMTYIWINNDDPAERVEVPWALIGQSADASQAFGSALTYSQRYFLLKYFNVATPEDDPDKWRRKQREAANAEDEEIAKQMITQFDKDIREYLASNKNQSDKIKKLVSKYVKDGDYFAVKDPAVASKMLGEFQQKFLKEETE